MKCPLGSGVPLGCRESELNLSDLLQAQHIRSCLPAHQHMCSKHTCLCVLCVRFPRRPRQFICVCACACMFVFCTLMPHLHPVWSPSGLLWRGRWSCSGWGFKEGLGQQPFLPTYTLIHGARPSASNSIGRASWLPPKPPKLIYPTFSLLLPLKWGLL